jgi:hypothetical protein
MLGIWGGSMAFIENFGQETLGRMRRKKDNTKMCPREAEGLAGRWFVTSPQYC